MDIDVLAQIWDALPDSTCSSASLASQPDIPDISSLDLLELDIAKPQVGDLAPASRQSRKATQLGGDLAGSAPTDQLLNVFLREDLGSLLRLCGPGTPAPF